MNQPLFYGNLLVTIAFGGFAGVMLYRLFHTKGKIKYAARQWDATKITLMLIVGLTLISMIGTDITVLDIIRVIVVIIAVVAYWLAKDGLGEDGYVTSGKFHAWKELNGYDYKDDKKYFNVYLTSGTKNGSSRIELVEFDFDQKADVIAYLKSKVGNKYKRLMKK
ncbi:MAG: DUF5673 domain-containing protein [Erysipelotrichaceae bacterium]|nr:DUF5673 domain-containing protein [Erysipelotrichaceae bacterium]MDY6034504.1 DUF5673 domain-containing protein [Bulleidia sp.]